MQTKNFTRKTEPSNRRWLRRLVRPLVEFTNQTHKKMKTKQSPQEIYIIKMHQIFAESFRALGYSLKLRRPKRKNQK